MKPIGNLVKKFIEHARARHVSVFPIQNLNMEFPCVSYKKKNTLRFLQVSLGNAMEISNFS